MEDVVNQTVSCPPHSLTLTAPWLLVPVFEGTAQHRLEIFYGAEKQLEMMLPFGSVFRYFAPLPLPSGSLTLRGNFPDAFWELLRPSDTLPPPDPHRPLLHYAPPVGWCNDPNGLVLHDGQYELYHQYNPCDTVWNNMSWGHAVSTDLLHWQTLAPPLLPNGAGTMFSGCALRNDRGLLGLPESALLYFYTVAGGAARLDEEAPVWSAGKPFTQNLAYSLDEGKTILRPKNDVVIGDLGCEARDPQVFWYPPRKWYCMALYLRDNLFAVYHSRDLKKWEQSQTFSLAGSWECPNLFPLTAPDGQEIWCFWSADGFYYLGSFDGLCFHCDCVRQLGTRTPLPYAAQIYSGLPDRTVMVTWLRTQNPGCLFRGMFGIPRELSLAEVQDAATGQTRLALAQRLPREWFSIRQPAAELQSGESCRLTDEAVLQVELALQGNRPTKLSVFGQTLLYDPVDGLLRASGQEVCLAPSLDALCLLFDRGILEISARQDTLFAALELPALHTLCGAVSVDGACAKVYAAR